MTLVLQFIVYRSYPQTVAQWRPYGPQSWKYVLSALFRKRLIILAKSFASPFQTTITRVVTTEGKAIIVCLSLLHTHWVMGFTRKHPNYIQYVIEGVDRRQGRGKLTFKERHWMICHAWFSFKRTLCLKICPKHETCVPSNISSSVGLTTCGKSSPVGTGKNEWQTLSLDFAKDLRQGKDRSYVSETRGRWAKN